MVLTTRLLARLLTVKSKADVPVTRSLAARTPDFTVQPRPVPEVADGQHVKNRFYDGPLYQCRRLNRIRFDTPTVHYLDDTPRSRARDLSADVIYGNWSLSHPKIEDREFGELMWWNRMYSNVFANAHRPCRRDHDGFHFCANKDSVGSVHILDSDPLDDEDWITLSARVTPIPPPASPSPTPKPSQSPSKLLPKPVVIPEPHVVQMPILGPPGAMGPKLAAELQKAGRAANALRPRHVCGQEGDVTSLLVSKEEEQLGRIFGDDSDSDAQSSSPVSSTSAGGGHSHLAVDTVFWGDAPASCFFQHWIQNNLPKLAAASLLTPDLLTQQQQRLGLPATGSSSFRGSLPSGAVVAPSQVPRPIVAVQELLPDRFPIVRSFHDHFGWGLTDYEGRVVPIKAKRLIYACGTPPLHPWLWQKAHSDVLKIQSRPLHERDTIVFCGRGGNRAGKTENSGRRILNENELLERLDAALGAGAAAAEAVANAASSGASSRKRTVGLKIDYFNHERFNNSVPDLLEYFSRARAIVGPHGGCLSNVVFAGCNTVVLELMPLWQFRPAGIRGHGLMMWVQSAFLEHDYHLLPLQAISRDGDVKVPVDQVANILRDAIDAQDA